MNICYITSDIYAAFAGISLVSLYENNKHINELNVYVISDGLSEINQRNFVIVAKEFKRYIEFIKVDSLLDYLKKEYGIRSYNGSSIVYARIFLDMIMPDNVDKILYIDSDTIITGSLSPLEEIMMGNAVMCMAENFMFEVNANLLKRNEREIFNKSGKNFNDGVIWFSLANWKKNNIRSLVDDKMKKGEEFSFAEQSIINCAIPHELIISLKPKYNSILNLTSKVELKELIDVLSRVCDRKDLIESEINPVIIHYLGDTGRPWFKECTSREKDKFDYYKSISPWKNLQDISYYKSARYKNSSLVNKIKLRIIISLYHSHLVFWYKHCFRKIGKW